MQEKGIVVFFKLRPHAYNMMRGIGYFIHRGQVFKLFQSTSLAQKINT